MPNPMCTVFPTVTRYIQCSNLLSFTFAWLTEWSKKRPPTIPYFLTCSCWISTFQLFVPIVILWSPDQTTNLGILISPICFTNIWYGFFCCSKLRKNVILKVVFSPLKYLWLFQLLKLKNIGVKNWWKQDS